MLVPGPGLEPGFSGSKPDVLPLDDPGEGLVCAAGFEPTISTFQM